jgi:hypothetical protein
MNAVTTPKSDRFNLLEGVTLTALFQGFPTFASAALLLKIMGSHQTIADRGVGAVIFVALASVMFAMLMTKFGPKYPRFFKTYEPLFYDASLSFSQKLAGWRTRPVVAQQLVTTMILMSLLAVAVVCVG